MEQEISDLQSAGILLEVLSPELLHFQIQNSTERVSFYVHVPEQYPSTQLIIEVSSNNLPIALKSRIENSLRRHLESLSTPQLRPAYEFLHKVFTQNQLLYCWEEIMEIRKRLAPTDSLSTVDRTGTVILTLNENNASLKVKLTVPEKYPAAPAELSLVSSTIQDKILQIILNQAKHAVVKCFHTEVVGKIEEELPFTREQLKHELDFIKIKQDLVEQSDDKAARRLHTRLVKREIQSEKDAIAARQGHMQETIEKSLFPLAASFIASIRTIPNEVCLQCRTEVLGSPDPERVLCGHWFHMECLAEYMRTPPFEKYCPQCKERVFHPSFPTDPVALERMARAWSLEQAHERELQDVRNFLDF